MISCRCKRLVYRCTRYLFAL